MIDEVTEMLNEARSAYQKNELEIAINLADKLIALERGNIGALLLRSQVYHKQQKWGDAINDLNRVLEIEPDNHVARNYKTMIQGIISFWNKDTYNP